MMGCILYPKHLWITLVGILTTVLTSGGSSITWYEPPPIQTLSDTDLGDHFANSTQLLEGTMNASLSWNFSLSADLDFDSLTLNFGVTDIAGVRSSGQQGVQPGFKHKFDIRWTPSQIITLIIFNVTTEVSGTFGCTVHAAKQFATVSFTSNIQVQVVDPPSNIVTSHNITVTAPNELTLNCSADGKPKPIITWTRLSDNTVVTMPLNITGKQDAGGYRCTVDNGVGSPLTKDVFITVLVHPKIDYSSSDLVVCENSTVILSCNATGEPPPNIIWKRVGDDEILPAVDGVYVIDSIKRNSSGRYRCKADNGVGIDSKTVNVTVRFAASIDGIINSSNTVNEGGFFNMTCQASDNPLPTNYTWINKDGLLFNESVLSFINISRAEAGQYRCEVENQCGIDGRNTYVNVYYPPNITSISLNQTVVDEGDVVLLKCAADGNPEPYITWNRLSSNGTVVHVGPAKKYMIITGKQDEGGYRCIADNGIGNAAFSDVLNITVESYHPINTVFSTNLTNNAVNLNESFTLICNTDANPAASYRLYREQESLQEQSSGTYLTFVSTRTKQVTYMCIPFNDFGDGLSKTITVTVYYNPDTVRLVANATENRNCSDSLLVNVTCDASEANPPVENYQLLKSQQIVETSSNWTWIRNISSKGDHNYSCRALHSLRNVESSNHVTVTFNVPVQVSVHVKSGNETLTEGGNVSVYCGASAGYPEPSFSWLNLNTSEVIPGQWLTFINISKEKAGDYICNASNTCGEKQSSVTTIDVQYKPENVHLSTSSHKICAGKMVILTCSAGDSNPAAENFTLYKNGLRLANVARAKVGVFNQMLYAKGQHSYSCVTSNAIGNASSSNTIVEVEVPVQISVHVQSGSETLLEGGNVSLHCSASGYAEATVTWAKLNADDLIVSGQWLNFTFICKEATGEYICNANNTCGKNQSSVRTIDVQYKPENVHLSTSSRKICAGTMVILTCSAGDSNPAAENFTLYKNGLRLANVTRAKVGVFNQMLYTEGQHSYSCVASNAIGNASSSNIIVEVEAPASVTVENRTIVVREGDNVTLHCLSSGFPRPNIFWVNDSNYITEAGGTLNLTNISRHSRKYNCSASNACGNDSRRVDIDVQYSAEATGRGGNYSVPEGSTKLFSCPVDGNPEPEVAWYKGTDVNGRVISNAKQLEATETGCYTCSASNLLGAKPVTVTQCLTVGRNCETNCVDGKECLAFGTKYFCRCPDGTTGENCGQKDTFTDEVEVGLEFTKEEFKPEYENLEDQETKQLIQKVEQAIIIEMNGSGLNRVVVTKLRSGSVIANVELKFNRRVGKGTIEELIDEALKDNKLGDIDVGQYTTDGFIPGPEEPISVTPTSTGQPSSSLGSSLQDGGGVVSVVLVGVVVIWWCI